MKYKIIAGIVLFFLAIQFIPYGRGHTNPAVVAEPQWDAPQTRELFFRTCSNCHSHETEWPWYSHVAPVSWLVQHDVDEGREHFNVSMWGVQRKNHGDEAAKEFRDGDMPPWFYLPAHPEAELDDDEHRQFLRGLIATFGEKEKGHGHEEHEE